ncbi:MAG: hypothetical protein ACI4II_03215 [Acutalibacteraceae bacterium]
MKKCEFCGKEISYFDQYCNEKCESDAKLFYSYRLKSSKIFSAVSILLMLGVAIGGFMFLFGISFATIIMFASATLLGAVLIIFPFGTDSMLKKYGIKHSSSLIKKIGAVICILGAIFTFVSVMYIIS